MSSIRRNALAWSAALLAVVVAGGMLALDFTLRASFLAEFDELLRARAEGLAALVRWDGRHVEFDYAEERASWPTDRSEGDGFSVFVGKDGGWRLLERRGEPIPDVPQMAPGASDVSRTASSLRRCFTIEQQLSPEPEDEADGAGRGDFTAAGSAVLPIRVVTIADRTTLDRRLTVVRERIWMTGILMILAAMSATAVAVGRGLRPIADLSLAVGRIDPSVSSKPIDPDGLPSELRPIGMQVNALRGRAETAVSRERWFASAASHELRTPIAEARAVLEVALLRERSDAEWRRSAESALAVLARMQALAEVLLAGTRSPGIGQAGDETTELPLAPALRSVAERACDAAGVDRRLMQVDCESTQTIRCNAATFEAVIGNVLRNALEHGTVSDQCPVAVRASATDRPGMVRITVVNFAPDLRASEVGRMFDPLWRGDASRNDPTHFGLGLPIAQTLATTIGARLVASLSDTGFLQMTLETPESPSKASEP